MLKKILFTAFFMGCGVALINSGTVFAATPEQNYEFYCAQCHGSDGKGGGPNAKPEAFGIDMPEMSVTPRNHTSPEDMTKLSDMDIENAIIGGGAAVSKSTIMPPFGKTLTEKEIKDLVAYLRKLCKCKGN